jgi:protein-tyrosine-phosphatase
MPSTHKLLVLFLEIRYSSLFIESELKFTNNLMILNELFPGENVDVPDPYFGLENGFEKVYDMLDEVCSIIAEKLMQK